MMRSRRNARIVAAIAGTALLAAGVGAGFWLARSQAERAPAPGTAMTAPATDSKGRNVLYWYDPMVPDQHFDKPG